MNTHMGKNLVLVECSIFVQSKRALSILQILIFNYDFQKSDKRFKRRILIYILIDPDPAIELWFRKILIGKFHKVGIFDL